MGYVVKLTAIAILYAYMYLDNKRRDREAFASGESEDDGIEGGMLVCSRLELMTRLMN